MAITDATTSGGAKPSATIGDIRKVATVFKQFTLHHGFPGRISTGGNLAFPFTPPEVVTGPAYRFSAYHVMETDDLPGLFPVFNEQL